MTILLQYKKVLLSLVGFSFMFFMGAFLGQVEAQTGCTVTQVSLNPSGNLFNGYPTGGLPVDLSARIAGCEDQDIRFQVWAERGNAGADVPVGGGQLSVGAHPLVDVEYRFANFGEESCVLSGRSPQCQYYLTFERMVTGGGWMLVYSSEGVPLYTTRTDVIGYNCNGACGQQMSTPVQTNRQNLQATYDLTLTSNNTSWGNVQGSGTYPAGTAVSAVAAPVFGNQFQHWLENGSIVSTDRAIQVLLDTSDRALEAVFATGAPPGLDPNASAPEFKGECTVGPVRFDPSGNLLFQYPNGLTATLTWLVTDCYDRTLTFAVGAHSAVRSQAYLVVGHEQEFNDSLYGGTAPAANEDLIEFTAPVTLGVGACDPNLFPSCQYFFEVTDTTSSDPNLHEILYSSREDILRSTGQDVIGFDCIGTGGCGANPPPPLLPGQAPTGLTVTPRLLQKEYDLTIDVYLDGSIAPTTTALGFVTGEGAYPFNSEVNVQAIPQAGYEFTGWVDEIGDTESAERIFVLMNGDRQLEARFGMNTQRNVTVNVVGTGSGTVSGDGLQPAEATIELIANPTAGSRVRAWRTAGGEVIGRANSLLISFIPNEQGQLVARANGISLPNISPTGNISLELEIEAFQEIGLSASQSATFSIVPCGDETKPDIDVDGDGTPDDASYCDYNFVILTISRIINFIFLMVLPIAGVIAVVTGIMILTSGGNPEQRNKAKRAFTKFIIGIIIVMVAWLLVATVLRTLGARSAYSLLDVVNL